LVSPPKEKIVLCAGGLFLWFNTHARQGRPAQLQVQPGEAPGISRSCFLDCGRVTVFPEHELAAAQEQGSASNAFLIRVIEEVEQRAVTLVTVHRRAVAEAFRLIVTNRREDQWPT
jgi:hypothetical protein